MKPHFRLTRDLGALAWGAIWECVDDGRIGYGRSPLEALWNAGTPT